jgi:mutator protein MutT
VIPVPRVHVAIALVWRDGRLLVTRRRTDQHLAGSWEFPGGKFRPGETVESCAEREVKEETGVTCAARARRGVIHHDYAERRVALHPVDCDWIAGEPSPREVAAVRWVLPDELASLAFPEANATLLAELAVLERTRG